MREENTTSDDTSKSVDDAANVMTVDALRIPPAYQLFSSVTSLLCARGPRSFMFVVYLHRLACAELPVARQL